MADYIQEIAALVAPHLPVTEAEAAELIAVPPDPELGDYAIPCHKFAKELKKAPVAIASELVANVTAEPLPERILSVQAAGPFVNITLDPVRRARTVLHAAREAGAAYGGGDEGVGKTLVMDYSHPNIAKPFGIGHLRSTVIGAAIYRLHRALGWKTVGVNHLGDWGTQFGKLITAYKKWGQGEPREQTIEQLYDMYVRFHKAAEDDPALDDEGRAWHKRMEDGDPEALALWEGFREASLTEFKRIYARLKVDFDSWNGESFYRDKVAPALQLAIDKGVAKEDDGAWIVDLKEDQLGVWLLRKSDGATLYATRDLAAAIYRAETYRFDRLLYVVGTPQSQHFAQLFRTLDLLGFDWANRCEHVAFGQILGMSTRKGTLVFLDEVLNQAAARAAEIIAERNPDLEDPDEVAEQVGVGAIVFADLSRRRIRDYHFDWDEILNFDGETGPYAQYTHARLCSILRKAEREAPSEFDASLLSTPEEIACVKAIERYPDVVRQAAAECEPYLVTAFAIDLCTAANSFYQKHRVNDEADPERTNARLALVDGLRQTLRNALEILGLHPLERM